MYVPRAMYSLRMSFWIVPLSLSRAMPRSSATTMYIASSVDAVALIVIDVETLSSGMSVEQRVHVLDAVDRDADTADLALRARRIRVDPHLRREIERDAQPGLAGVEQVVEAPIRLRRRPESGVLPHGPEAAAVHRRLHAPRERELPGIGEVARVVDRRVVWSIDRRDRKARR